VHQLETLIVGGGYLTCFESDSFFIKSQISNVPQKALTVLTLKRIFAIVKSPE